jgi:protein-S-isoprenylcysteine O-methyltransferase Ste14
VGAVLMAVPHILGPQLDALFVARTPAWQWLAVALVALGLGFSALARAWLGGNWSGTVTVKQGHELIRSGPYALVRHPIYSGMLLALIGSALMVGKWRALIGLALIVVSFVHKLKIEERFMAQEFGEDYARYREEVAMLVPFLV